MAGEACDRCQEISGTNLLGARARERNPPVARMESANLTPRRVNGLTALTCSPPPRPVGAGEGDRAVVEHSVGIAVLHLVHGACGRFVTGWFANTVPGALGTVEATTVRNTPALALLLPTRIVWRPGAMPARVVLTKLAAPPAEAVVPTGAVISRQVLD